jgi:hypothetical protein
MAFWMDFPWFLKRHWAWWKSVAMDCWGCFQCFCWDCCPRNSQLGYNCTHWLRCHLNWSRARGWVVFYLNNRQAPDLPSESSIVHRCRICSSNSWPEA